MNQLTTTMEEQASILFNEFETKDVEGKDEEAFCSAVKDIAGGKVKNLLDLYESLLILNKNFADRMLSVYLNSHSLDSFDLDSFEYDEDSVIRIFNMEFNERWILLFAGAAVDMVFSHEGDPNLISKSFDMLKKIGNYIYSSIEFDSYTKGEVYFCEREYATGLIEGKYGEIDPYKGISILSNFVSKTYCKETETMEIEYYMPYLGQAVEFFEGEELYDYVYRILVIYREKCNRGGYTENELENAYLSYFNETIVDTKINLFHLMCNKDSIAYFLGDYGYLALLNDYDINELYSADPDLINMIHQSCHDRDYMLSAIEDNYESMRFASNELKSDKKFILKALEVNPHVFEFVNDALKVDKEFIEKAVAINPEVLNFVPLPLKDELDLE